MLIPVPGTTSSLLHSSIPKGMAVVSGSCTGFTRRCGWVSKEEAVKIYER